MNDNILYHSLYTPPPAATRQAIMPDRSLTYSRAGAPPGPPNPPALNDLTKNGFDLPGGEQVWGCAICRRARLVPTQGSRQNGPLAWRRLSLALALVGHVLGDAAIGRRVALGYTIWLKGNTGGCEPLNRALSLAADRAAGAEGTFCEQPRPALDRELHLGDRRRRPQRPLRPRQVPGRHPAYDGAAPGGRGAGGQQAGRARDEGGARPDRRRRAGRGPPAGGGTGFYNTSKFTLRDLRARASRQQLRADFEAYLDGFSPNVQDILENFEFRNQIPRLSKADALGTLIEKLTSPDINLSPAPVKHADGSVRYPGLDNHGIGSIFEELVRRFNEENNEEAGEHWTPRDAVRLMAKLVFLPVADELKSGTYLLYDGACGTGGMLTVAEETLGQLAAERGKDVSTHLFGQEINAETYAICTADLLLKGEARRPTTSSAARSLPPSPTTPSRPASSTSCSPTHPTARAGRPTWSAWAARRRCATRASLSSTPAIPSTPWSPAPATVRCSSSPTSSRR